MRPGRGRIGEKGEEEENELSITYHDKDFNMRFFFNNL